MRQKLWWLIETPTGALILVVIMLLMVVFCSNANAGEFADSAQGVENNIDTNARSIQSIMEEIISINQRLNALEQNRPTCVAKHAIPGVIQAEDYASGANGVTYMDTTPGNTGGAYRTDDVDIKEVSPNQIQIGWTANGEWLIYSTCSEPGLYDVYVQYTNGLTRASSIKIEVGPDLVGQFEMPPTPSWDTRQIVKATNVSITAQGETVVKLTMILAPIDIDWIEFVPAGTDVNHAPTDILLCDLVEGELVNCE